MINNQIIADFAIGQHLPNGIIVLDYAGTSHIINAAGVAEMQLYKISLNGEIYYASNAGLKSNDLKIFDKVIGGVGYRGYISIIRYGKEYTMWKDMIYRCCSSNNMLYPYYGGAGVTIYPKWMCFELFVYDLITQSGYEKINSTNKVYVLDIETKQKNRPENSRMYAPNMITLKQYYSSDVYSNCEKAKESGTYTDCTNIKMNNLKVQNIKPIAKPYKDGSYPLSAYEQVVTNPPSLPIPDNDDIGYNAVRMTAGVKYL